MKRTIILLILALCLFAATAQAASTYYVSSAGTIAGTTTTPWSGANLIVSASNLQSAMSIASSGDTIYAAGTFTQPTYNASALTCGVAGTATAPIRLIGCNPSTGVNDGTRCNISAGTGGAAFSFKQQWVIDNFAFVGYVSAASSPAVLRGCSFMNNNGWALVGPGTGTVLIGCDIGHSANGSGIAGTMDILSLLNCIIHDNDVGMSLMGHATIRNCLFYNNKTAIDVGAGGNVAHVIIDNCTITGGTVANAVGIKSESVSPNSNLCIVFNSRLTHSSGTACTGASGMHLLNTYVAWATTGTGSITVSDSAAGLPGLVTGTAGNLNYTSTATNNYTLLPSAPGYQTATTAGDGLNAVNASQGVQVAASPVAYSTNASAILSGSYSATGGTLGNVTIPTVGTVALGTSFGSSLSLSGTYGSGLTATAGSVANGATFIGANAPTVNSGTLTIAAAGATVVGSNFSLTAGTLTVTGGTGTSGVVTGGSLAYSVTGYKTTGTLNLAGSNVTVLAGSGTFTIGNGAAQTPSAPVIPPIPLGSIPPKKPDGILTARVQFVQEKEEAVQ